jgi:hypothetical protein
MLIGGLPNVINDKMNKIKKVRKPRTFSPVRNNSKNYSSKQFQTYEKIGIEESSEGKFLHKTSKNYEA